MKVKIDREKLTKEEQDRLTELEALETPDPTPEPEIPEAVQKMLDDTKTAMAKMTEDNKVLAEKLQKAEDDRQLTNFVAKADKELPMLPGVAADKGKLLQTMAKSLVAADYDAVMVLLKAGEEAMKIVADGDGTGDDHALVGGSAMEKIHTMAKARVEKGESKSLPEAIDAVIQANPELAVQHTKETRPTKATD
jgi:hypothetical protein